MEEFNNPYYIELLKIDKIHDLGYTGEGVKIAIIDSGADYNHVELYNKIKYGVDFTKENNNNFYDYMDANGHGTGVLGEIIKIAPRANVIIIKCINQDGRGNVENINKAIKFAIEQKVDIINMSIGTPKHNSDLEALIKKAVENNICVVTASGNDGDGNGLTSEVHYPAYYNESISVGSLTKDYQPSFFSASNDLIDLLTFGEGIPSIYPNDKYGIASGTSQACPIVSGVLALMKQYLRQKGEPTEIELYNYLIKNVKKIVDISTNIQGKGYLCLDNFIKDIKGGLDGTEA